MPQHNLSLSASDDGEIKFILVKLTFGGGPRI